MALPGISRRFARWGLPLGGLLLILLLWSEELRGLVGEDLAAWVQMAAVLILLVALYVSIRRRVHAVRERHLEERFRKATRQLHSGKLHVRVDATYALEGIARESVADHWRVMLALTAFVRENSPWPGPEEARAREPPGLRADVEMALTVIGGRRWLDYERKRRVRLDLSETDLRRAVLVSAHLERADLHRAHLERGELWRGHLEGANLSEAHLEGANLSQADLEGANLSGAGLAGANLQFARLQGANLKGADLTGARLTLAHLEGADLTDADGLTPSQLKEAYKDSGTTLPDYIRGVS